MIHTNTFGDLIKRLNEINNSADLKSTLINLGVFLNTLEAHLNQKESDINALNALVNKQVMDIIDLKSRITTLESVPIYSSKPRRLSGSMDMYSKIEAAHTRGYISDSTRRQLEAELSLRPNANLVEIPNDMTPARRFKLGSVIFDVDERTLRHGTKLYED
jgi:hypothetical protein